MQLIQILFIFLFSLNIIADGQIIFTKGDVFINSKKITSKPPIKNNDTLTTGKSALAILKLADGSNIKINENSSLTIGKSERTI